MLKELLWQETQEKEKDLQGQTQAIKKMVVKTHLDNCLKCKWIKCPQPKTQTGWMVTKIRLVYMLSTGDTFKTYVIYTDWKWGVGKDITCKYTIKRKLE